MNRAALVNKPFDCEYIVALIQRTEETLLKEKRLNDQLFQYNLELALLQVKLRGGNTSKADNLRSTELTTLILILIWQKENLNWG